jgi:hypothetical protein
MSRIKVMEPPTVRVNDEGIEHFLRLCLGASREPTALDAAREIATHSELDWDAVLRAARRHRVAPLLYSVLRAPSQLGFAPKPFIQSLRDAYDYTARTNIFLFNELSRIIRHLSAKGVRLIVLKGAGLAQTVYSNPALRPLRDLDILVHSETLPIVLGTLKESGYVSPKVETRPGTTVAYESQMMFVRREQLRTQLEIHWSLIDSPHYQHHLSLDWFWQTARPLEISRVSTLMLGPEALVLYLCAHLLLHHGGNDLLWLNDIAEVIRHYRAELDWDELMERAQLYGLVIPLQQILTRVASDWSAPISANVIERLVALPVSREEMRAFKLFRAQAQPPTQRLLADLASIPSWRQRLVFGWSNIFPSRDYMRQRYHTSNPLLLILSYPYRWFLGVRHALSGSSKIPKRLF